MGNLTKNYATAIYEWLNTFAPTYREPLTEGMFDENNPKPNEYIVYSTVVNNFSQSYLQSIIIYSHSTAYTKLMEIVDRIESAIGEFGLLKNYSWGNIKIYKGNPFYQDKIDEDSSYRAGYINLQISIYEKGE